MAARRKKMAGADQADGEAVTSRQRFREATTPMKFRQAKMAAFSRSRRRGSVLQFRMRRFKATSNPNPPPLQKHTAPIKFSKLSSPKSTLQCVQRLGTLRVDVPQDCSCTARLFEGSCRRRTKTAGLHTVELSFNLVSVIFESSFVIRADIASRPEKT
ncbi:hypothetical protein HPB52_011160 [Rhipicephalus sanguineus]|uniref:Uncharacterized protein n=1 Tax=Rhipicephalus sanguineus TaxID=34632 RepID=A0A9D4PCT7_RHISA|nr:hypothetical protein HPB52_011160 [Rhipicephalus sanguineus]